MFTYRWIACISGCGQNNMLDVVLSSKDVKLAWLLLCCLTSSSLDAKLHVSVNVSRQSRGEAWSTNHASGMIDYQLLDEKDGSLTTHHTHEEKLQVCLLYIVSTESSVWHLTLNMGQSLLRTNCILSEMLSWWTPVLLQLSRCSTAAWAWSCNSIGDRNHRGDSCHC